MTKIKVQPDCGNSPRKLFLKNFTSAIAHGDEHFVGEYLSEKTIFTPAGKRQIAGKVKILTALKKMPQWNGKSLTIDTIITHGRDASDNGTLIDKNGISYAYSNVYKFKGAGGLVLLSITNFTIKEK